MFDPLSWLSDRWFGPIPEGAQIRARSSLLGHRLGFRRGYLVGAWTGVLVAFAFVALTGCAPGPTVGECAVSVYVSMDGSRCYDPQDEDASVECCEDVGAGFVPVGLTAEGSVICFSVGAE